MKLLYFKTLFILILLQACSSVDKTNDCQKKVLAPITKVELSKHKVVIRQDLALKIFFNNKDIAKGFRELKIDKQGFDWKISVVSKSKDCDSTKELAPEVPFIFRGSNLGTYNLIFINEDGVFETKKIEVVQQI